MAVKKRKSTKKGGRRVTSRRAYMKTAAPRRKRRATKSKGFLSELIDKKSATAGAKALVSGATVLKAPYIGAGMGAIAMYKLLEHSGMLAEHDYLQDNATWADVDDLPLVLNDDGSTDHDYLQANMPGQSQYLQEHDYLQENSSYDVGYYGMNFGG